MLISKRIHGLRSLQAVIGVVASLLLFWLLLLLLFVQRGWTDLNWSRYVIYSALVVMAMMLDFFGAARWEPRQIEAQFRSRAARRMALEQSLAVFMVLVGFLVAFKDQAISRLFLLTFLPLQFLLLYLLNSRIPSWLGSSLFRGTRCQKTLLAGDTDAIHRMEPWLKRTGEMGLAPVGVVVNGDQSRDEICGIPRVGTMDQLPGILHELGVSLLLHSNPPKDPAELTRLRDICDANGTRLVVVFDLGDDLARQASFFNEGGRHFMSFREEPLESPANRVLKRTLDVVVSLLVTVTVLPVATLLVWILQKLQAPGPLLFRQARSGLHNEEFIIYKYRTMYVGNPEPHVQATEADPRVFPAGRWLRRLSIDELPQFINVLRGEMSIVGPRPHMPEHDRQFGESDRRYRVRHLVKPGITGLAQVRGLRGQTLEDSDVTARTSADLHYLENWSLGLDITIIARTAFHVLRAPRSAF